MRHCSFSHTSANVCISQLQNDCRTLGELHDILREIVRNDMNKLESEFRELDEYNSGRLTQEMMYQLLSK